MRKMLFLLFSNMIMHKRDFLAETIVLRGFSIRNGRVPNRGVSGSSAKNRRHPCEVNLSLRSPWDLWRLAVLGGARCEKLRLKNKSRCERADKPGSVVGRPFISNVRRRTPQARNPNVRRATVSRSYLRLLRMGFSKPRRCRRAGALLPHRFSFSPGRAGGVFFSVALSVGSPRPAVSWHPALWSPDFPHTEVRDRLARSHMVF